jgi:hypothetical protein
MLLIVAICMAVLSVVMWRIEANAYLGAMHDALSLPGTLSRLGASIRAFPLLFPLALDLFITIFLVTTFGLGGGVTGAVVALAMSNAVSIAIAGEAVRARKRRHAASQPPPTSQPTASRGPSRDAYVPRWVEAYNRGFFSAARWAVNKAEEVVQGGNKRP